MRLARSRAAARAGFTLLEILVVVAILVVMAGVGGVVYMRYLDDSKIKAAQLGVQSLDQAVQAFKIDRGEYPESLQALLVPEEGRPAILEQKALIDPWNRPFVYDPTNTSPTTGKPRIYSQGPNVGNAQTQISNW